MTMLFHVCLYALAVIGALTVATKAPHARAAIKERTHAGVMRRIAHMELEMGMGIDYADEWLAVQKPKYHIWNSPYTYTHIGKLKCVVCHKWWERGGSSELRLCPDCRRKAMRRG